MKKIILGLLAVFSLQMCVFATSEQVYTSIDDRGVEIDNKVSYQMMDYSTFYTENSQSYLRIRDVAAALNGTAKQFDLVWHEDSSMVEILPNTPYTFVGGELAIDEMEFLERPDGTNGYMALQNVNILVEGEVYNLSCFTIDGNNYIGITDLAKILDFAVYDKTDIYISTKMEFIYPPEEDYVIEFENSLLENAIIKNFNDYENPLLSEAEKMLILSMTVGMPILNYDADGNLVSAEYEDLSREYDNFYDVKYFKNLTSFTTRGLRVTDLSPLFELENLKSLSIESFDHIDIAQIDSLEHLEYLYLDGVVGFDMTKVSSVFELIEEE
ncbi:MAG: hypothetical protein R3Y09_04160 [Clostridia bacterium]